MEGSFTIPADRVTVWAKLNDPAILKRCISGCQTFERTSDTQFIASGRMKVGPVSTLIRGRITLHDVDAPNGCRILGEGEGGIAGFARGAADVKLAEVPEGTAVTFAVEATVGGRIARLGGRLIDGLAKRMADQFFAAFAAAVSPKGVAAE